MRKSGKVTRRLGILIQDINEELAKSFGGKVGGGASSRGDRRLAAQKVAARGDIVTAINGEPVSNVADLRNKIAMTPPNSGLKLRILRDGQEKEVVASVGEQPADMASMAKKMTRLYLERTRPPPGPDQGNY